MEIIKLTHPQKMLLGWAAINNERGDDGTLRIEGKSTLVKKQPRSKRDRPPHRRQPGRPVGPPVHHQRLVHQTRVRTTLPLPQGVRGNA